MATGSRPTQQEEGQHRKCRGAVVQQRRLIFSLALWICLSMLTTTEAAAKTEREILIEFYDDLSGDFWYDNDNWADPESAACSWYGVMCADEAVIRLELPNNNLHGNVTPFLYHMPNLTHVILRGNRITDAGFSLLSESLQTVEGEASMSFGPMKVLDLSYNILMSLDGVGDLPETVHELNLEANKLRGVLPMELFNLDELQRLNLNSNDLSGTIPPAMEEMASLVELRLDSNKLSGMLPGATLGNLVNLEVLTLAQNHLTGTIPLGNLPETLHELNLEANKLQGKIPTELVNLDELQKLNLNSNDLTGTIAAEMGDMTSLIELRLDSNELSGRLPGATLGNLVNLEVLTLAQNHLTGSIPFEMEKTDNLRVFHVAKNKITGDLPAFGTLKHLQELVMDHNHLTGTIPPTFLGSTVDKSQAMTIGLSHNDLRGTLPEWLERFTSLTLDAVENQLTGIHPDLCSMGQWMDGLVGLYGCDAILCPAGTYNDNGRQMGDDSPCMPCDDGSNYFGSTSCSSPGGGGTGPVAAPTMMPWTNETYPPSPSPTSSMFPTASMSEEEENNFPSASPSKHNASSAPITPSTPPPSKSPTAPFVTCPDGARNCYNGAECIESPIEVGTNDCNCTAAFVVTGQAFAGLECEYPATMYCHSRVEVIVSEYTFCTNGGVCTGLVGPGAPHPGCDCPQEFYGEYCQYRVAEEESEYPSVSPSRDDSTAPSETLSSSPSMLPSAKITNETWAYPSGAPSTSMAPSAEQSMSPTSLPSQSPSYSNIPSSSRAPSVEPSLSQSPSLSVTTAPSVSPTEEDTSGSKGKAMGVVSAATCFILLLMI